MKKFKEFIKKPCVILTGPPGCGKGTHSKFIHEEFGWLHVATGDILRKSKDETVKKLVGSGNLLPDDLVEEEFEKFINGHKKAKGFILDGYPRTLEQKELFEKFAAKNDLDIMAVFFLEVSEETMKKRIEERSKTSGRKDDQDPKVFEVRMKEYKTKTLPMIKSFKGKVLVKITEENSLEEASDIIIETIKERMT